jgi:hypothetical protein
MDPATTSLSMRAYGAFRIKYPKLAQELMPNLSRIWDQIVMPAVQAEVRLRKSAQKGPILQDLMPAEGQVAEPLTAQQPYDTYTVRNGHQL